MKTTIDNSEDFMKQVMREDEVYLLMVLARKKDNQDLAKNARNKYRFIVTSKDHLRKKLDEIDLLVQREPDIEYRVYVTINSRNVRIGMRDFHKKMLDWNLNIHDKETEKTVQRLDLHWFSELARPPCSSRHFMMIDLDTQELEPQKQVRNLFDVVTAFMTKNGVHFIIEPNKKIEQYYQKNVTIGAEHEIKRDGMTLLKLITPKD